MVNFTSSVYFIRVEETNLGSEFIAVKIFAVLVLEIIYIYILVIIYFYVYLPTYLPKRLELFRFIFQGKRN